MTPAPSPHHLDETVLSALGVGEFTVASIRKLAAAESSKHALLLEAIRRASNQAGPADGGTEIANAISVLAEVQARAPGVISEILALPQLGFWAADCLTRLRACLPGEPAPSLSADLGHLAGFAAVAALRAGHHCESSFRSATAGCSSRRWALPGWLASVGPGGPARGRARARPGRACASTPAAPRWFSALARSLFRSAACAARPGRAVTGARCDGCARGRPGSRWR